MGIPHNEVPSTSSTEEHDQLSFNGSLKVTFIEDMRSKIAERY